MENKAFNVSLEKNPLISMRVIPGHFTTSTAHLSHYLDVSRMKSNAMIARDVGRELAVPYISRVLVDAIVCMEGTEVIAAYLAENLLQGGMAVINGGSDIHVLRPISSHNGYLIFTESAIEWIRNRNVLLLVASISSGRTVRSALECLTYYGGNIAGISALFLASPQEQGEKEVHALFTAQDIPGYQVYRSGECEMCKAGQRLDAMVSSDGYTKL